MMIKSATMWYHLHSVFYNEHNSVGKDSGIQHGTNRITKGVFLQ